MGSTLSRFDTTINKFRNTHAGETALLVGNGVNLHLTPPAWFDYPAFGMNTIVNYEGWMPQYYVAVDHRVMREFGERISERYRDIPKFITSDLEMWRGENFYTFTHLPADLKDGWKPQLLPDITYHSVMHVAMQIAFWMGFTTLLMIGVHHEQHNGNLHFWGVDNGMPADPPVPDWFAGYETLVDGMRQRNVKVLNISPETCVPEEILPTADWREYAKS